MTPTTADLTDAEAREWLEPLPCPFCGEPIEIECDGGWWGRCRRCIVAGPVSKVSRAEAVAKWNHRPLSRLAPERAAGLDWDGMRERAAQIAAHRACCGTEHDPANGKLHGYCVVCGVPWPCAYAGTPPAPAAPASPTEPGEAKMPQEHRRAFEEVLTGPYLSHRDGCDLSALGCSCGLDKALHAMRRALDWVEDMLSAPAPSPAPSSEYGPDLDEAMDAVVAHCAPSPPEASKGAQGEGTTDPSYSENERAEQIMGPRVPKGETPGIPIDMPCELGYWCPVCRVPPERDDGGFDGRLQWSEYAGFLWCSVCNYDYPSALCVRFEGSTIIPQYENDALTSPSYRWGGRDYAVKVFLDSVQNAPHPPAVPASAEAAEIERLTGWLRAIEGGDRPIMDEGRSRQMAYEATVLGRPAPQ